SDRAGDHRQEDPDEDHQLLHSAHFLTLSLQLCHCPVLLFLETSLRPVVGSLEPPVAAGARRGPRATRTPQAARGLAMRECSEFDYLASAWGRVARGPTRGFPASPHTLPRIPARGDGEAKATERSDLGFRGATLEVLADEELERAEVPLGEILESPAA